MENKKYTVIEEFHCQENSKQLLKNAYEKIALKTSIKSHQRKVPSCNSILMR